MGIRSQAIRLDKCRNGTGTFRLFAPSGGVNARVHAMEVHGNALYVAGDFDQASGIPTSYLAKWDGTQWYPFNMTFGNFPLIRDIAFFSDSLIISGNFPSIDGDTT